MTSSLAEIELSGCHSRHCDRLVTLDDALYRTLIATREANHIADVLFRWNVRFRIFERKPGEYSIGHVRALEEYRKKAIAVAEDAGVVLAPLWDCYSRLLEPPLAAIGAVASDGYIGPAGGSIEARPLPGQSRLSGG
jgi:hypothetical protein